MVNAKFVVQSSYCTFLQTSCLGSDLRNIADGSKLETQGVGKRSFLPKLADSHMCLYHPIYEITVHLTCSWRLV